MYFCEKGLKVFTKLSPFSTWLLFLLPWQQHVRLKKTDLRLYTINMQSFTTTHSQTSTQCFCECDHPVCLQTYLDSIVATLRYCVVQKGLNNHLKLFVWWVLCRLPRLVSLVSIASFGGSCVDCFVWWVLCRLLRLVSLVSIASFGGSCVDCFASPARALGGSR